MKIVTKQEIEERIANKFPNEPFELIEYTKVSKPIVIKCMDCGLVSNFSNANNFLATKKEHWCICHQKSHQAVHYQTTQKISKELSKNTTKELLEFFTNESNKSSVKIKCLKCNQIFQKTLQAYLINNECPYCENGSMMNHQAFLSKLSDEYSALTEYQGTDKKILIRHNKCGFIWKTTPHFILQKGYSGCPKCNKKRSKGEQRIEHFLTTHQINFEIERIFDWQTNKKCRFDFYIPDFNLVCEFMGRQHYEEAPGFCDDTLQERQARDELKRQDAINAGLQYLAISYLDINNIDIILEQWFNDYPEREQG